MMTDPHQYIERTSGGVRDERLKADRLVRLIYSNVREKSGWLLRALTSKVATDIVAWAQYDHPLTMNAVAIRRAIADLGIDPSEILEPSAIRSLRDLFERKITYWRTRPMTESRNGVVSPCDARMIPDTLEPDTRLFIKQKFFDLTELLGCDRPQWIDAFQGGTFAVFRLTPDKYHYNHVPVTGNVVDFYGIRGRYHSCNPVAAVELATVVSKNKRVVTILDSDVPGGTGAGLVAMVEIAALMIGDIEPAYSDSAYDDPRTPRLGEVLLKGQPKSLFRPGSSTVVLLFQKDRFAFSPDLLANVARCDVKSRFSRGFGRALVETDLRVREDIGTAL